MKRNASLPIILVCLSTILFQLPFFDRWISYMDEGHILQYANLIADGGQLYRDATVYPLPGAFYFLALLFHVFEPSILLARIVVLIEFALFTTFCFAIMRRLVPGGYAIAAVGLLWLYRIWSFPHWQMYSYSTTALLLLVISMWLLLRFFDTDRLRTLAAAGFLFGLGVLCKQDYGAAALAAFLTALIVYGNSVPKPRAHSTSRLLAYFLGPAALVGVAMSAHFLYHGVYGDLLGFTVVNHVLGIATYNYRTFPDVFPLFLQDPALRSDAGLLAFMPAILVSTDWHAFNNSFLWQQTWVWDLAMKVFYYGPYAIVALGIFRLVRHRDALKTPGARPAYLHELTLLALAGFFMLLITLNRPQDYVHLVVLYWPILCLSVIDVHAFFSARPRFARSAVALALVPALIFIGYTGWLAWLLRTQYDTPFASPRASVYAKDHQARNVDEVVDFIQTHTEPDQRVAALPYSPLFNFLSNRKGPHRTGYIIWPVPEFEDRDLRVADAIEESGAEWLIYDFGYFHDFPRVADYAPDLFRYLVENFEMEQVFTSDDLWPKKFAAIRRQNPQAEGVPLLSPDLANADLLIGGEGLPPEPVPLDSRADYIQRDLWPFRPVLALKPTTQGQRTTLSVPLDVPDDAQLRTSIGIKPVIWDELPPSWVQFEIVVRRSGSRDILFSQRLDSTKNVEDRGWFDVSVSLADYAGERVHLEFSTQSEKQRAEHLFMGGWGEPRIVTPRPKT